MIQSEDRRMFKILKKMEPMFEFKLQQNSKAFLLKNCLTQNQGKQLLFKKTANGIFYATQTQATAVIQDQEKPVEETLQ